MPYHFYRLLRPREGSGEAAISNFFLIFHFFVRDPRECRGDVAFVPYFGPQARLGEGAFFDFTSDFFVLCWGTLRMQG